ncbi:MAG: hypothetical protein H7Y42_15270 [Chitinophagaceae bacterium]|nr:hypothetical protein [Chitinophagaceae bacterium]
MEYLLFVFYLVLFAWLVTKVKFFTRSGLNSSQLIILFLLKVMAGIFYGWMGLYYGNLAQMVDTWAYHHYGIAEYQLLWVDPWAYLTNLFHDPYPGGVDKFFGSTMSYWNDLKGNIFVKFLSMLNILSFGHYYVNVIAFSFISLFGPIALYRVMIDIFPGKKLIILLAIFLTPSFIYWTSGLYKEGLIFTAISIVIYNLYFGWKEKRYTFGRWFGIVAGLFMLLVMRNYLMVLILPAVLAWLIASRWRRYALGIFTGVYLACGILFFTARYILPSLDFPKAVVAKQQAFLQLQGGASAIPIKELEPTAQSFFKNTPQAVTLSFLRPFPGDVRHLLSLAASIEINLLICLFILFMFFRKKTNPLARMPIYLCLFLSVSVMLAIGFSVNNLGAIVRYRSIVLPLMIIPMAAQIDWRRLGTVMSAKNKKIQSPTA